MPSDSVNIWPERWDKPFSNPLQKCSAYDNCRAPWGETHETMFGVVPKRVWQKRYPCDENNSCLLAMRCLLIDTGSRKILIDNGTGDKQLDYLKYYGFKGVIDFDTELAKIGYTAADITDVVFTHLHFDHCGGATRYNADKTEVELVFPNAVHWVGQKQWENFLNPNVREGDSYFPENMNRSECPMAASKADT